MLGTACVHVVSSKQKIVTRSTPEAELVAADAGAAALISINNLLKSIGFKVRTPILFQDNTSAMALIEEGGPKSFRTRHIALKYFYVSEQVHNGDLIIKYCPTESMTADILTKALQGEQFMILRNLLMNSDCIVVVERDWQENMLLQ
jgi:hypothetical protein